MELGTVGLWDVSLLCGRVPTDSGSRVTGGGGTTTRVRRVLPQLTPSHHYPTPPSPHPTTPLPRPTTLPPHVPRPTTPHYPVPSSHYPTSTRPTTPPPVPSCHTPPPPAPPPCSPAPLPPPLPRPQRSPAPSPHYPTSSLSVSGWNQSFPHYLCFFYSISLSWSSSSHVRTLRVPTPAGGGAGHGGGEGRVLRVAEEDPPSEISLDSSRTGHGPCVVRPPRNLRCSPSLNARFQSENLRGALSFRPCPPASGHGASRPRPLCLPVGPVSLRRTNPTTPRECPHVGGPRTVVGA